MEWWRGQGAQMSPNPVPGVNHCWLEPGLGQRGVCEHCGRVTGPGHRAQDHNNNNNNNNSGTLQTQPRRRVEPQYGKFSKTHEKSLKRWHGDLPSWQLFNSHSKDHRTLAPSCAISTINHVVISGSEHRWTKLESRQTCKPVTCSCRLGPNTKGQLCCAVRYVLSVSEMYCHSAGADEVLSSLPMSFNVASDVRVSLCIYILRLIALSDCTGSR